MRRAIIRDGGVDPLFSTPPGAARLLLVVVGVAGLMATACGGVDRAGKGSGTAPAEPELTGGQLDGSYEVMWETTSLRVKGKPLGGLFSPDSSGTEKWTIRCGDSTCSFQSDDLGDRALAGLLIEAFEIEELEVGPEGVSQEGKTVERCGQDLPGVAGLKKVVTTAKLDLRGTEPQMVDGEPVFTQLSGILTVDPSELQVKMKSPLGFTLTCKYSGLEAAVSGTRVP